MGLGDASAGLGLHHQDFLPKSTHEALFLRRYRRDISEAHFRAFWRQALPGMPCRLCWALALQNAVNTVKNCCAERFVVVLSVLLLLWLARVLRIPCFFPVGFRAFWRVRARATPATKRIYLRCFVAFAFPGWLAGCSFWAAFSGASGARARDPMSAFWVGARLGPRKLASSASSVGVGNMHNLTNHIIAQNMKNMT